MKLYTTGEVAKICKVAVRTVCKWTDHGDLKSFRIPGSQHRRIPHDALIKFLKMKDYPTDGLVGVDGVEMLLVSKDANLADNFRNLNSKSTELNVQIAVNSFDAAICIGDGGIDFIVIDFTIDPHLNIELYKILTSGGRTRKIGLIALVAKSETLPLNLDKFIEVFEKPFDPELLGLRILRHAGVAI